MMAGEGVEAERWRGEGTMGSEAGKSFDALRGLEAYSKHSLAFGVVFCHQLNKRYYVVIKMYSMNSQPLSAYLL